MSMKDPAREQERERGGLFIMVQQNTLDGATSAIFWDQSEF